MDNTDNVTIEQMYDAVINGVVTREQFEEWCYNQRDSAVADYEYAASLG